MQASSSTLSTHAQAGSEPSGNAVLMNQRPDAWILVAFATTAGLVMVALGVARATGVLYAIGLAGLIVVGVAIGEWLLTLWGASYMYVARDDDPGLILNGLWLGRTWLPPVALVALAALAHRRRVQAGGSVDTRYAAPLVRAPAIEPGTRRSRRGPST